MSTTLDRRLPAMRPAGGAHAVARGVAAAIGARPALFVSLAGGFVLLSIALPPIVLAVIRKPWTYFAFNPWLKSLPAYLASERALGEKLDFLSRVALFWFSADGPYGAPEWGFAVDTMDLARMAAMGLVLATYFCLVVSVRDRAGLAGRRTAAHRSGGALGALVGVLGLSTGPCSVVGCGASVLPVVGLAFEGLSSGTLALLSGASRVMTVVVATALCLGVVHLALMTSHSGPRPATQRADESNALPPERKATLERDS